MEFRNGGSGVALRDYSHIALGGFHRLLYLCHSTCAEKISEIKFVRLVGEVAQRAENDHRIGFKRRLSRFYRRVARYLKVERDSGECDDAPHRYNGECQFFDFFYIFSHNFPS